MRECRVPLIVFIIEILQSGANSKARSNQGPHREPQSNYPLAKQWTSVVATHSPYKLQAAIILTLGKSTDLRAAWSGVRSAWRSLL